jgi:putative tryptophan/tyrosine transport system substrate-binding protein
MAIDIGRRQFVSAIGGAAVAWPLSARSQQQAMPVIGFLSGTSAEGYAKEVALVHKGLNEADYFEGRNFATEYRWANFNYDQLPSLATELITRRVAAIVTVGTTLSAQAAKNATTSIPIVFVIGADPVHMGLVGSLNRPGGNLTGITLYSTALVSKRLEILRSLVPKASLIGFLMNPKSPASEFESTEIQAIALTTGIQLVIVRAQSEQELDAAFAMTVEQRLGGMLLSSDALFSGSLAQIVSLAARHAVPILLNNRQGPKIGGLISYASDRADVYRQAGIYAGRILKGEKPADLPVQQPTKFELVINLKTAKVLGLVVPTTLLATADEVIE